MHRGVGVTISNGSSSKLFLLRLLYLGELTIGPALNARENPRNSETAADFVYRKIYEIFFVNNDAYICLNYVACHTQYVY